MAADLLRDLLKRNRSGEGIGLYSVCSGHPRVLEAAMQQALRDHSPLLIESTSNQVDQFGGYTGMTPDRFVAMVHEIAAAMRFPRERLLLGGDHLGPNVWSQEAAASALAKARDQVSAYVHAGYLKLHLDATMACGDDPAPALPPEVIAERTALLCAAAEYAARDRAEAPLYIIGSDVPIPGGAQHALENVQPTAVDAVEECIALTRQAFRRLNLDAAWERVIAVVVQPGVEFGHDSVVCYDRDQARPLRQFIAGVPGLVYEAHSTDYQTGAALRQLVEDHFALLKVGPWLTFALREALFLLAEMERLWLAGRPGITLSHLVESVDAAMTRDPRFWKKHYHGSEAEIRFARHYSYSDRIRYYWPDPEIVAAVQQLQANLEHHPLPLTLISQYLPDQYQAIREGRLVNDPAAMVRDRIGAILGLYASAASLTRSMETNEEK